MLQKQTPQDIDVKPATAYGKILDWLVLSALYPDATLNTFLNNRDNKEVFGQFHLSSDRRQLYYLIDKSKVTVMPVSDGWLATLSRTELSKDQDGSEGRMVYEDDKSCFALDMQVAVCRCIALNAFGNMTKVPCSVAQ